MTALRIVPLVVSALLLAAHFYRAGGVWIAGLIALTPLLLLARRQWTVPLLQIGLFVGAAEWIRTAVWIGSMRAAMGQPSTRMFVILTAVALFTILAAVPLNRLSARAA